MIELARNRSIAGVSLALTLVAIGALSRSATAFNPQPDPPGVGMLGIAADQTIRINLVNLASSDTAIPPPCRARLSVFAADGTELAGRNVIVPAGRATFLDYAASFAPPTVTVGDAVGPLRAEVLPSISTPDGAVPPPCRLSVEIFDNATGRTQIAILAPPCRGAACRRQQ